MWLSICGGGGVHWVQVVQGAGASGALSRCVPCLSSCLLSLRCFCFPAIVLYYAFISRFKGVFRGFWGACVGLCCLGALRGLCGFYVRERLGGLKACGVFAFLFLFLSLCLLSFYALCLLCSGCLSLSSCIVFVALWVWLLFLFPFRTIRKKKGRNSLRPLFVCCVLVMQNRV